MSSQKKTNKQIRVNIYGQIGLINQAIENNTNWGESVI